MDSHRLVALLTVVLVFSTFRAALADGEPDESFANEGILVQNLGSQSDHVAAVRVAPSGRILVAGDALGDATRDLLVLAFTPAGDPDPSFAGTGRVTADFGGDEEATALAITRDGRIVVVGTRSKDGVFEVVVVRYLGNGTLDTSFNGTGRRVLAFSDGADNFGNAVALELDGRIVIGGTRTNANGSVFAVARLWPDGSFDESLDGNGKKFIDFGIESGRNAFGNAIAVQDDRKIVVAGTRVGSGGADFALARLDPEGALDGGFGSNGKTDIDFGPTDEGSALAIRPDGRIVMAGTRTTASGSDFAIGVLRPDGTPDTTFKGNGKATTDFGAEDRAHALVLQPDNKIVAVGEREGPAGRDFAIARYGEDGLPDASLDSDGKLRIDVQENGTDVATGVDLQQDGKIVVVGTTTGAGNGDLGLTRRLSTASLPTGSLEIPSEGSAQSGVGLISGWLCDAPSVRVRIDGQPFLTTAYGTARGDTAAACGDTDNGFGLLFNWSLLSDGPHILRAFAQGRQFTSAVFEVQGLGVPFLRGASGSFTLPNFPSPGSQVGVRWTEALQGFVIDSAPAGTAASAPSLPAAAPERPAAVVGSLENPGDGSVQSGIGLISGWVCDATNVQVFLDDQPPVRAAYGTVRGDTESRCGDTNNGFGLLYNWNLLGDGPHTIVLRAGGEVLGSATFTVTTLGAPFRRGLSGRYTLEDFPTDGASVDISWAEAQQNFVIVDRD